MLPGNIHRLCIPETEIDPIGNAPVTISASISGEVVTKADNNYQPAEGNKKIFLYYKDGSNVKAHEKGVYSYSGSWTAELSGNSIFWDDLEDVNGEYPFFAVSPTDLDKATTGLYRAKPKCQRRLRQFRPADGIL